MSNVDLRKILEAINRALEVFASHRGRLSVDEISTRSMLSVLQHQVRERLLRDEESRRDGPQG